METVIDLLNQYLHANTPSRLHKLDYRSDAVISTSDPTLNPTLDPLSRDPLLLCANTQLLAYVNVFMNDLLGLDQGLTYWR